MTKETIVKRLPIVIISIVSTGLLAGCGTSQAGSLGPAPTGPDRPASSAGTTQPSGVQHPAPDTTSARPIGLETWFTRQGKLFVTERTVPATVSVGRVALDRMLAGPSAAEYAAGLRSQIPAGTRVRGLDVAAGTATVDLSSSFTTATCGTGCRGDYSVPVRYAVTHEEPGTIEVFETSMENGQPLHVQLIPVTLAP